MKLWIIQAKDMVGASNASTIHVTDEGNVVMHTSFDHDNLAYIEDDVDHKNDVNHNSWWRHCYVIHTDISENYDLCKDNKSRLHRELRELNYI